MSRRTRILEANQAVRNGSLPVRKLEEGYVALRIPTEDWKVLRRLYPELESKDHTIRLKAWKKLEASPIGDKYRVTQRSPSQVKRAADHRIIVK